MPRYLLPTFLLVLLLSLAGQGVCQASAQTPTYRVVDQLDQLPFKEVTDLLYDSDGMLWMATRNGLYGYDGYHLRPYRRDGRHLDMLSDNEVRRILEDRDKRIWIATSRGLDRLDKHTGRITHLQQPGIPTDQVTSMLQAQDGRIWFASYQGFFTYDAVTDSLQRFTHPDDREGQLAQHGEQIIEDHRGNLWLGTWGYDLMRYDPKTQQLVKYPQMNSRKSSHVIQEDDEHRIWVGGWGAGVHVLENAWDLDKLTWQTFTTPDLIGNISYSMHFDADRHQMLIGSSRGITVADTHHLGQFTRLLDSDGHAFPGEEVTGIVQRRDGQLWIGMIGGGVVAIEPSDAKFGQSAFDQKFHNLKTTSVRSIYADRNGYLWMGIGTQGLAVEDLSSGQTYNWNEIPALTAGGHAMTTVYAITQTYDGHIWVATYDAEIIDITPPAQGQDIRSLKAEIYKADAAPFAPSARIYTLFEDHSDNLWIAGAGGIVKRRPDRTIERYDTLRMDANHHMADLEIRHMTQAADGSLWLAALHDGVYHLTDRGGKWEIAHYCTEEQRIGDNEIQCVCCDSQGAVWAGSNYGDLYLLNRESDRFVSVKEPWHLPGAAICFIMEDPQTSDVDASQHRLWVGTNEGLLRILPSADLQSARVTCYTQTDGLLDKQMIRNAATVTPDGRLFFGTYKGYNYFSPARLNLDTQQSEVVLSEILIGDTPWEELPDAQRFRISALAPHYTREITLRHEENELALEFSLSGNMQQKEQQFAYQMEGYDTGWRYTWSKIPRIFYSNLPPGTYTFRICDARNTAATADTADLADTEMLQLTIHILPAWYATRLARSIYVLLAVLALFLIYRGLRSLKSYYRRLLVRARERAALRKGDIIIKSQTGKPEVTNADRDFIERAIRLTNEHLSDPAYDQQRFLDDIGVSKATCFRRLKALTGQSYTTFVRDIKMKAALKLQQENPTIRISDLAYAVGFSDPKYFSTCFKKYFGKLPSEISVPDKGKSEEH